MTDRQSNNFTTSNLIRNKLIGGQFDGFVVSTSYCYKRFPLRFVLRRHVVAVQKEKAQRNLWCLLFCYNQLLTAALWLLLPFCCSHTREFLNTQSSQRLLIGNILRVMSLTTLLPGLGRQLNIPRWWVTLFPCREGKRGVTFPGDESRSEEQISPA